MARQPRSRSNHSKVTGSESVLSEVSVDQKSQEGKNQKFGYSQDSSQATRINKKLSSNTVITSSMKHSRRRRKQRREYLIDDRAGTNLHDKSQDNISKCIQRSKLSSESKFRLLLVVISSVIYFNSLGCNFVYDDRRVILENHNVVPGPMQDSSPTFEGIGHWLWRVLLIDDFWGTPLNLPGSHKSYRPLVTLSFAVQNQLTNLQPIHWMATKAYAFVHVAMSWFNIMVPSRAHPNTYEYSAKLNQDFDDETREGLTYSADNAHAFMYHSFNLLLHILVCDLIFQLANRHFPAILANHGSDMEFSNCETSFGPKQKDCRSEDNKLNLDLQADTNNQMSKRRQSKEVSNKGNYIKSSHVQDGWKLSPIACAASLLFVCHPIHVEAVTSLVGRAELLGALLALWSLRNMIEYLISDNQVSGLGQISKCCKSISLIRSSLFAALACLSKENSASVLLLNILLAVWSLRRQLRNGCCSQKQSSCLRSIGVMLALMCAYSSFRIIINRLDRPADMNGDTDERLATDFWPKFSSLDNPLAQDERQFCLKLSQNQLLSLIDLKNGHFGEAHSRQEDVETKITTSEALCSNKQVLAQISRSILMTRLYLPAFCLKLLVWPHELSYDWSLIAIKPVSSPLEPRFMLALCTYAIVFAFMVGWLYQHLFGGWHSTTNTQTSVAETQSTAFKVSGQLCYKHELIPSSRIDDEAELESLSETSSVLSLDTLKSFDSGYIGANSTPRNQTPDSSACCNEPDGFSACCSTISECNDNRNHDNHWNKENSNDPDESELSLNSKRDQKKNPHPMVSILGSKYKQRRTENRHELQAQLLKGDVRGRDSSIDTIARLQTSQLQQLNQSGNESYARYQSDQLALSLCLMLVPYLPASNLLIPVGFLVAERTLYLPSVGFCLLVSIALNHLANQIVFLNSTWGIQFKISKLTSALVYQSWKNSLQEAKRANFNETNSSNYKRRMRPVVLLTILPFVLLGSIKTIQRNLNWLNEASLFESNIEQSPAKSLANLASLYGNIDKRFDFADQKISYLKRALELEPHSADLHYNMALALQKLHLKLSQRGQSSPLSSMLSSDNQRRFKAELSKHQDPVEFHYNIAIQLRPNFALAALNLAAWQYGTIKQLAKAEWNLIENCATRMSPAKARNHNQHVRTQVECLISGARLMLGDYATTSATTSSTQTPTDGQVSATADGEQTKRETAAFMEQDAMITVDASTTLDSDEVSQKCSTKILAWMRTAREKIHQINDETNVDATQLTMAANEKTQITSTNEALDHIGDLDKQLANINWIESRCERILTTANSGKAGSLVEPNDRELDRRRRKISHLLNSAFKFALRSWSPMDANIYLDCAKSIYSDDKFEAINLLKRALSREKQKAGSERSRIELLVNLGRHYATTGRQKEALELVEEALKLAASTSDKPSANHLTLAGQLAYDSNEFDKSQSFYEAALKSLLVDDDSQPNKKLCACSRCNHQARRRLASAHANFGAILQVNRRPSEAQEQYRRALVCDQNNSVAAANLKRISPRLAPNQGEPVAKFG